MWLCTSAARAQARSPQSAAALPLIKPARLRPGATVALGFKAPLHGVLSEAEAMLLRNPADKGEFPVPLEDHIRTLRPGRARG